MPSRQITEGRWHFHFNDPDECPYCHRKAVPQFLRSHVVAARGADNPALQIAYACPSDECGRMFVATYQFHQKIGLSQFSDYRLRSLVPVSPKAPTVAPEVKEMSPSYVTILAQAAVAEGFGLDQVAGMGYRKALEYLVKDFVVRSDASVGDAVRKELLGSVIANRIADANIRECAKRATWLGNDETHYERRWEEHDIADLKALIQLTETWILSSLRTEAYLRKMPEGKK